MEEIVDYIFRQDTQKLSEAIESGKFKVNDYVSLDRSALALAAACGYLEVMQCLLDHGADINLNNGGDLGYTPIEAAARDGKVAAIELLVANGADINKGNTIGSNALIGACIGAHQEALLCLLSKGADINHADQQGQSALHYLCRYAKQWGSAEITQTIDGVTTTIANPRFQEHTEILKILLEHQAAVNLLTAYGYTPLHLAAESNAASFIPLLVSYGAIVNAQNSKGFAPLHAASDAGHLEACQALLAQGADVNIVDADGFTPILGATAAQNLELVKFLLASGANTTTAAKISYGQVKAGDNALSLAVRLENEALLSLFV